MSRARILVISAGVGVLLVVAGLAWVLWPRGVTEVDEQDALDDFRQRAEPSLSTPRSDDASPSAARSGAVPRPGVYTYAASGQEDVKLGPLPAETRRLPDTVTAIVVADGDGCFQLTLNLFAEHTEDTRYCTDSSGALTVEGHTKHQRIGPLSPTATMSCDPATLVDPGTDTTTLKCGLSMSGGPVAIDAQLVGTTSSGPTEQLIVGEEEVATAPVTVTYEVTGDLTGTWTETLWRTDTFLPVRIERSLELSGPAALSEQSLLDLVSLEPST